MEELQSRGRFSGTHQLASRRVDDRTILLCWKLGEQTITHWHGTDEGYKYRKPIDEKIANAGKKPRSGE